MSSKEELIARIIEIEWKMFHTVPNEGGTASCQEDPDTFRIMRRSQAMSWSAEPLESWLGDLENADKNARNLMTEKYARMMQSTSPFEYAQVEHLLPPLEPDAPRLIDEIADIVLGWEEDLSARYPYVLQRGRPIHSSEDSPFVTSLETYLRGELATYSVRTLELYLKHLREQQAQDVNCSAVTLDFTMRQYGFKSLDEANAKLKAGAH